MTIQKDIRARDFFLYKVYVEAGKNTISVRGTTVTIPAGWYYQGHSTDADYPGLWSTIEALSPAGTTLHACTPIDSFGQVSCGLEFRAPITFPPAPAPPVPIIPTYSIAAGTAVPAELLGWAPGTTSKTGVLVRSDLNLPGIWRANSLVAGIANIKSTSVEQVAFRSHKSPRARFTKWESYSVVEWSYPAVEAVYVKQDRSSLVSYAQVRDIAVDDLNVNFERLWISFTRGHRALIVPDTETRPNDLGGLTVLSWGESSLERAPARRESTAQERYSIDFETYIVDTVAVTT
jgi:hypothetical protein